MSQAHKHEVLYRKPQAWPEESTQDALQPVQEGYKHASADEIQDGPQILQSVLVYFIGEGAKGKLHCRFMSALASFRAESNRVLASMPRISRTCVAAISVVHVCFRVGTY